MTQPPAFLTGGATSGERGAGLATPELDWGYVSEALPGGRRVSLPRGRLVGGSSMVNGCVEVRGRPEDFERWVAAGAAGWGWEDVLPFYEAVEREIPIMCYAPEHWLPGQRTFVDACRELGFRYVDDLNEPDAWDGVVGPWPRSRRNEIRQGTLVTYIRKARNRPNFEIRDDALVDRVLFDGTRAVGVAYVDARGREHAAHADTVVLSAGAYGSPAILLRSGIGPADHLRALGIAVVVDLPVGRQLLDHPCYPAVLRTSRDNARLGWPALAAVARGEGWWGIPISLDEEEALVGIIFCLATTSGLEGSIRLRSRDPAAPPVIDHGLLGVVDGGGFECVWQDLARLLETDAYTSVGAVDVHAGVPERDRLLEGVASGAHPAGTCAIGSVVDAELRVLGVDGLLVVDASVFPMHVTNNPNHTCHMIGEVAAATLGGG